MRPITGTEGTVDVDGTTVAHIEEWELRMRLNADRASVFGKPAAQYIAGLTDWEGEARGRWSMTDPGQKALQDALKGATTVDLRLFTEEGHCYWGSAYITELEVRTILEEMVEVTFEFRGADEINFRLATS